MKYKYKFSITLLVLVIYLFSINQIISLIFPDKTLKKVEIDSLSISTDYVRAGIDGLVENGNTLEDISITGWAFAENQERDDSNKNVYVLLQGSDNTYISSAAQLFERSDIYNLFNETIPMAGNKNGFTVNISSYNLKDGFYDIYIYCVENDASKGLYKTSSVIEKRGKRIQAVNTFESTHIDEALVKLSDTVSFGFDSISVSNSMLQIKGWALNRNSLNEDTEYYIQINSENQETTYTTSTFSRYDVNNHYNVENNEVGFDCSIPLTDLSDELEIQVMIKENGEYTLSTQKENYRIINNNFIEKIFNDAGITSTEFCQKYNQADTYISDDIIFKLDSAKEYSSFFNFAGWGTMFNNVEIESCDYYLLLENSNGEKYYWKLSRNKREDIASAYGDEHILSGFTIEIGKTHIQEEEIKLKLLVIKDNCIWISSDAITVLYKDKQLLLE